MSPIKNCPIGPTHSCRHIENVPVGILLDAAKRELGLDVGAEFQGIAEFERFRCQDCGLIFFTPWCPGSKEFYTKLGEHSWYQPNGKWEYSSAAALINETDRVLDIGCGDGRFHSSVEQADYTGLDPNATQQCHELTARARILSEPLEEHAKTHPASYDVVCAFQVLEHVEDPRRFVEVALQCLRSEGLLILGLPNQASYLGGLMNFALDSPPHHLTGWSDKALRALEHEVGLSRVGLFEAPLEDWEYELYWMQSCYSRWVLQGVLQDTRQVLQDTRYSADAKWKWLIPLSYLAAKVLARTRSKPEGVGGSTMLWVATR